jgi:hypothetical protein
VRVRARTHFSGGSVQVVQQCSSVQFTQRSTATGRPHFSRISTKHKYQAQAPSTKHQTTKPPNHQAACRLCPHCLARPGYAQAVPSLVSSPLLSSPLPHPPARLLARSLASPAPTPHFAQHSLTHHSHTSNDHESNAQKVERLFVSWPPAAGGARGERGKRAGELPTAPQTSAWRWDISLQVREVHLSLVLAV